MSIKLHELIQESNAANLAVQREKRRLDEVREAKSLRQELDAIFQRIKSNPHIAFSAGLTNAAHYAKNAKHWLGERLNELDEASPYPQSTNPSSTAIEPPAAMAPQRQ